MTQYRIIGKTKDGDPAFVLLNSVTDCLHPNRWACTVWRRNESKVFGIEEYFDAAHLDGPNDPYAEKVLAMVEGEGEWHKHYQCAAEVAKSLGWCGPWTT